MIPIFEPYQTGLEKKYILECLKSNWISSQGPFVVKFEKEFAQFHNRKYAVATSSCTTALHLSLMSIGIGKGDEVICPILTFIAPANMIRLTGAKVKFVDIDKQTLTINTKKIEEAITKKTKAIIVVHQFGHAADMEAILKIAKKHKLFIIEDNAEALGGRYKNKILGSFGDIATFSFFSNKFITSGEGGVIITNNKKIYNKALIIRDHGMSKKIKYKFIELGTNYRITNLQAAYLLAQFKNFKKIWKKRSLQMKLYYKKLDNVPNIELRSFSENVTPSHWLLTLRSKKFSRDKIISYMYSKGIECRKMVDPVHIAKHFYNNKLEKKFKSTTNLSRSYFHLPSSTKLKIKEINFICDSLIEYVNKNN